MSCRIYMDHAATTEMLPEVREAMEPYLREEYGNASTSYEMGVRQQALDDYINIMKTRRAQRTSASAGGEGEDPMITFSRMKADKMGGK